MLSYNRLLICLTEWVGSSLRADTRFTSPSTVPRTRRVSRFVCPMTAWSISLVCRIQSHSGWVGILPFVAWITLGDTLLDLSFLIRKVVVILVPTSQNCHCFSWRFQRFDHPGSWGLLASLGGGWVAAKLWAQSQSPGWLRSPATITHLVQFSHCLKLSGHLQLSCQH